jgi:hypothetical protein
VLIRLVDVLTKVAEVERASDRLDELGRQAELVVKAGETALRDEQALADIRERWTRFQIVRYGAPVSGE